MNRRRIIFVILLCASLLGGIAKADDPNEGALEIESFLNTRGAVDNPIRIVRFSDSFLKFGSSFFPPGDHHNVTSFFDGQDNLYDQRPADSNEPFDIRLIQQGTTTESKTSRLEFVFPLDPDYMFGNQEILFQSDRLPYGPVVDIRKVINQNGGVLLLVDVPTGTSGKYGSGILTIGTRKLANLNDTGSVDLEDFSLFAQDWGKTAGQYVADISGPSGIPDGNVDIYDLKERGVGG